MSVREIREMVDGMNEDVSPVDTACWLLHIMDTLTVYLWFPVAVLIALEFILIFGKIIKLASTTTYTTAEYTLEDVPEMSKQKND